MDILLKYFPKKQAKYNNNKTNKKEVYDTKAGEQHSAPCKVLLGKLATSRKYLNSPKAHFPGKDSKSKLP